MDSQRIGRFRHVGWHGLWHVSVIDRFRQDRAEGHQGRASPQTRRASLTTIQASRAVAALLVALLHLSMIFGKPEYWGVDPARGAFKFGHSGVQFFFVLSGFIIFYIHRPDIGSPGRVWNYLAKRFIRIYPVYWVVLLGISAVLVLVPSFGTEVQRQWSVVLASLTLLRIDALLPSTWYSANELWQGIVPVSWTLFHEVLFYLMFASVIRNRAIGAGVLGVWFASSLLMLAFGGAAYPVKFLFSPLHILFALGLGVCWLVQERRVRIPALWAVAGVTLFLGVGMTDAGGQTWLASNVRSVLYGVGSSMAIAGLVTLEQQGRIVAGPLLRLLGDASYSIYLIHFTMFSAMAKLFARLHLLHALPAAIWYATMLALACSGGIALHLLVEKPLIGLLRARALSSHPQPVTFKAPAI
jgi:peptidoglycan/LPS O-acetylase OafA/YrhL